MFCNFFPQNNVDNVEIYSKAGQATDDNITRRMCFACWLETRTQNV